MLGYQKLNAINFAMQRAAREYLCLAPVHTRYRVVFEQDNGAIALLAPAPAYMAMLMYGHLIYRIRDLAQNGDKVPVWDGDGALLPPMSEREAVEFIAWKDVPVSVQRANERGNRPLISIVEVDTINAHTLDTLLATALDDVRAAQLGW